MANIKTWLETAEKESGEQIEAVVVGKYDGDADRWNSNRKAEPDENVVLSREDGLKKLDLEYDNGHGGADCYPMYAWTKTRVYLITEYDGSTGMMWLPRNPINCEPKFG